MKKLLTIGQSAIILGVLLVSSIFTKKEDERPQAFGSSYDPK